MGLTALLLALSLQLLPSTVSSQFSSSMDAALSVRDGREGWIARTDSTRNYVAIPLGPGVRIQVCAARCRIYVSTDAGPNHNSLLNGRIMDLDLEKWADVCQLPTDRGLCWGTWRLAPVIPLPETDTLPARRTRVL